jgi:hypothetical protein
MRRPTRSYRIEYLCQPGKILPDERLNELIAELRDVASSCFEQVPNYQCLAGTRDELSDKVITLARQRQTGALAGFCSAVLLPVDEIGMVLHLGLTCIRPDHRGARLTHRLTSKLVISYYRQTQFFGRLWCTNVACVMSSLGNMALNFDDVYPSPLGPRQPQDPHLRIAEAIDRHYRQKVYIDAQALFDPQHFVFRGSIRGTVFEKEASDRRFHHRIAEVNDFYRNLISFQRGDEVLQVGHVSAFSVFKYLFGRVPARLKRGLVPAVEPSR